MRRILVTGNAGAGKTTFAARLGARLSMPVLGLDAIVWRSGWVKAPPAARRQAEAEIAAGDRWLVDGVSRLLWSAADTVILLDVSRPRALGRALRRSLRDPLGTRPELPPGCPEYRILPELVRIIWNFPDRVRAPLLADAAGWGPERSLVILRDDREAEAFLSRVPPR